MYRNHKIQRAVLAILLLLTIAGCGTTAEITNTAQPLPGETGVLITRDSSPTKLIAPAPQILLDGQALGKLPNHNSLYAKLTPGQHRLHIAKGFFLDGATDFAFTATKGQVTHVQMFWGSLAGHNYTPMGFGAAAVAVDIGNEGWVFQLA